MTLLVKNVQIIGGTREFPGKSDVFVSGDRISAIGNFANKPADVVLDGQGAYLSPGFIDINTDSDHYLTLLEYPSQEDFLKQGVTTIFGGMCGSSLAPLIYGGLESLRKWGGTDRVNVNWHTMAEFLEEIDKHPLSVNFGTMVGHATIRRAILSDAIRDLTKSEFEVFGGTLKNALLEGGFGLSTGLGYVHTHKTPYGELKVFANIAKKFNGVYATHLRDGGFGVAESVDETIKLAQETGAKTLISHFVPVNGFEKQYEKALTAIEALPADTDFNFDIYPSTFTMSTIYTFLPEWSQNGGFETMMANVKDPWLAAKILKDMPPINEDHFVVAHAPDNEFFVGKTLREVRRIYGLNDAREALLKLMQQLTMRGTVLYQNLNENLIKKAIMSNRSFIASNAPSFGVRKMRQLKSERTTSTFIKFLTMAEEQGIMPIGEAIKKITFEPARKFNLTGRGAIQEGNFADLTCFKGHEVKFTIVNGEAAVVGGEFKKTFSGKALRHSIPT